MLLFIPVSPTDDRSVLLKRKHAVQYLEALVKIFTSASFNVSAKTENIFIHNEVCIHVDKLTCINDSSGGMQNYNREIMDISSTHYICVLCVFIQPFYQS